MNREVDLFPAMPLDRKCKICMQEWRKNKKPAAKSMPTQTSNVKIDVKAILTSSPTTRCHQFKERQKPTL
jgi:hypothetical protein